jgi:DNA-binding NarL/FixJ family response regulator
MFKTLLGRLETLWHKIEQIGVSDRIVILVTASSLVQLQLRVLSIQEGWHILFARTVETALQYTSFKKGAVVLYDHDLPGVDWRKAQCALVDSANPVFFILLSPEADRRLWRTVLDYGGYGVGRLPLDQENLAPVVNGAFAVASTVDSVVVRNSAAY